MTGSARDSVRKIVATGADANLSAHLPAKAKPVSLRRKSTPDGGTQEENYEWLPYLTDGIGEACAGRDPMSIPVKVLTESGHPLRKTRDLVKAFARGDGGDVLGLESIRGYRDIRDHCLRCAENAAEVSRCTAINCPFFAFRMGRNPHNPRRGRNPFVKSTPPQSKADPEDQNVPGTASDPRSPKPGAPG